MNIFRIIQILFLLTFLIVSYAAAIPPLWDREVISEIMRDNSVARANDAMKNNQDLYLNYQHLLIEQHVAQEAVRRGLTERLDVSHQLQTARRTVLINAMKEDILRQLPAPDMTEMQLYYQNHLAAYTLPDAFKLEVFELDTSNNKLMILAESMKTAKQLDRQKLLQAGAKQVMAESSTKWLSEKQIHKQIYLAVHDMKDHETRLVKLNSGLYFVIRLAYREKFVRPFEKVYSEILMEFKKQGAEKEWQNYLQKIKKQLGF
ncbi:secreted protein [Candidatus Magnetomorum sp. HK-1]|nr:secreted protein [Candidatus Magnetomorum sp. HK-1]